MASFSNNGTHHQARPLSPKFAEDVIALAPLRNLSSTRTPSPSTASFLQQTIVKQCIREFQTSDLPELRETFLTSRRLTFPADADRFQLADFDSAIEGELILVAQRGDRLVGFISWWPPDDFIHNLFIHPDAIRQGLGTALLQECLARLSRPAHLKCSQQNQIVLQFYQKHGWKIEAEGSTSEGKYFLMAKA